MGLISRQTIPLFEGFSLDLPFGLISHRDSRLSGTTVFITDFFGTSPCPLSRERIFSAMAPPGGNGWITCRAEGKTLHQRRIVPTRSRGSGSYTFFKIEMQTEEGETVCISGQLVASFRYRWSDDAEPVLKSLLRNMTYQKTGAPSLDQNE